MRAPRFLVSAAHKSSGKTTVSLGLARALTSRGRRVASFKKGPDYIDPMWLSAATGRPCYNLDFNIQTPGEIEEMVASRSAGSNIALIEGNKGLFDGLAADGSDSNAGLARLLGLPVILVIDTVGITRGIAPLLQGYLGFDPEVNIAGVILNKVGGARHEAKLRAAVAEHTDLPVLGAVHRDPALEIGERHLGLTTPAESGALEARIEAIAERVATGVDLGQLEAVAATAPDLPNPPLEMPPPPPDLRIAVARDRAFGFYYADDLEQFARHGAELVPFDTMRDAHLPACDGLFIGGGFPEMFIGELAANDSLRADIRVRIEDGLPTYAECGGLMYLARALVNGASRGAMVGAVEADAVMHDRPQGRGYTRYRNRPEHPWPEGAGERKAHEFHYAALENLPPGVTFARDITRGHGVDGQHDGIVVGNTLAGFCHLRRDWVGPFVDFVRQMKARG